MKKSCYTLIAFLVICLAAIGYLVFEKAGDQRARLWSFEVKRQITRATVRHDYFQAVSNSSWANFGYLVAAEIEGQDTLKEQRMLFAAHGIGLIKLDTENPVDSQVLIRLASGTKSTGTWQIVWRPRTRTSSDS